MEGAPKAVQLEWKYHSSFVMWKRMVGRMEKNAASFILKDVLDVVHVHISMQQAKIRERLLHGQKVKYKMDSACHIFSVCFISSGKWYRWQGACMTTEESIVYESLKLYSDNGYEAVSTRMIARAVGAPQFSFMHPFLCIIRLEINQICYFCS